MERKVLCSVSCLDSCCEAPHFVYQWTFQPIPPPCPPSSSSFVSYSFYFLFSLVCCRLSTPFICFNLVAHYSKEKAFCIEKKNTIIFFIPLSNNKYLFTAADSEKTHFWEPASLPKEAALVLCVCARVCYSVNGCKVCMRFCATSACSLLR